MGIGVLPAGGRLQQPQGLPGELVQVGGTDVTSALALRAACGQGARRRELVEKQRGEARVLGEQGTEAVRARTPGHWDPPCTPPHPSRCTTQNGLISPSGSIHGCPAGQQLSELNGGDRSGLDSARLPAPFARLTPGGTRHLHAEGQPGHKQRGRGGGWGVGGVAWGGCRAGPDTPPPTGLGSLSTPGPQRKAARAILFGPKLRRAGQRGETLSLPLRSCCQCPSGNSAV